MNPFQHQPPSFQGHRFRSEGGKSLCDQVSVDELRDAQGFRKYYFGSARLPRPIRPSQYNNMRTISHECIYIPQSEIRNLQYSRLSSCSALSAHSAANLPEHRMCSISNEGGALWLAIQHKPTTLPQPNEPVDTPRRRQTNPVFVRLHNETNPWICIFNLKTRVSRCFTRNPQLATRYPPQRHNQTKPCPSPHC